MKWQLLFEKKEKFPVVYLLNPQLAMSLPASSKDMDLDFSNMVYH